MTGTDPTADAKAALRKRAAAARKAAFDAVDPEPAQARLLAYVTAVPAVEIVSGYAPMRSEIDPLPVLGALHDEGYRICLPVVPGPARPLVFRAWEPGTPLVEGVFGARVPAEGDELEPELLIAPLLAFDGAGYRLGYGGGFYDRTLARLRAMRRTYAVGFAYAAQAVDRVPAEPTDQPLDAVVTEKGIRYPD